jgi:hypothetical protein
MTRTAAGPVRGVSALEKAAVQFGREPVDLTGQLGVGLELQLLFASMTSQLGSQRRSASRFRRTHPAAGIRLTYEEFADAVNRLEQVDFPIEQEAKEAWPHVVGWWVNYERAAYRLAGEVSAPRPFGPGRAASQQRRSRLVGRRTSARCAYLTARRPPGHCGSDGDRGQTSRGATGAASDGSNAAENR